MTMVSNDTISEKEINIKNHHKLQYISKKLIIQMLQVYSRAVSHKSQMPERNQVRYNKHYNVNNLIISQLNQSKLINNCIWKRRGRRGRQQTHSGGWSGNGGAGRRQRPPDPERESAPPCCICPPRRRSPPPRSPPSSPSPSPAPGSPPPSRSPLLSLPPSNHHHHHYIDPKHHNKPTITYIKKQPRIETRKRGRRLETSSEPRKEKRRSSYPNITHQALLDFFRAKGDSPKDRLGEGARDDLDRFPEFRSTKRSRGPAAKGRGGIPRPTTMINGGCGGCSGAAVASFGHRFVQGRGNALDFICGGLFLPLYRSSWLPLSHAVAREQ